MCQRIRNDRLVADRLRCAAAKIVDEQQPVTVSDFRHLCQGRALGEAHDTKVGRVHPKQRRRAWRDRLLIVRGPGAIRRPHLDHARTRQPHHVRHPEGSADLNELAARNHDLFALAKRGQRKQHGGRVVVDRQGCIAVEKRGEQSGNQRRTLPAAAALEVKLEVAVTRGDRQRLNRGPGKRRAPQVGVEDHAGRVDYVTQPRCEQ